MATVHTSVESARGCGWKDGTLDSFQESQALAEALAAERTRLMLIGLIVGFVLGAVACWVFGAKLAKVVFGRPQSRTLIKLIMTMPPEKLLELRMVVNAEVVRRSVLEAVAKQEEVE